MPGSKPGERRGGRQKGTPNKATVERETKLAEAYTRAMADLKPADIAAMSPLDVMLHTMKLSAMVENWPVAAQFAEKAAPYIHPKLTATTLDATVRRTASDFTDDELLALARSGVGGEGTDEADSRPN